MAIIGVGLFVSSVEEWGNISTGTRRLLLRREEGQENRGRRVYDTQTMIIVAEKKFLPCFEGNHSFRFIETRVFDELPRRNSSIFASLFIIFLPIFEMKIFARHTRSNGNF